MCLFENFHFHVIATDGVFARTEDGPVEFFEATELCTDDIAKLKTTVRRRVLRCLERHGCLDTVTLEEMLSWGHQGGFSLDASVRIEECPQAKTLRF